MGKSATPRLGDFERLGLDVEVVFSCGHRRIVHPRMLLKLRGPETRLYPFVLEEVAKRFSCSACHTSDRPTLRVVRAAGAGL
jgi:hypothetical protein